MDILILFSFAISFLITFIVLPRWIKKTKEEGFLWEDMNKFKHPKNVAGSGGVVVVLSFVIGVLYYIAVKTFFTGGGGEIVKIFSLTTVVLILAIVGIIDDFWGWKKGGISRKWRLILAFCASIPLVVIDAGVSTMNIPFFGAVNFGLIYPFVFVPLGIAGAATTFNFLAGYNGLETGQGIIILSSLAIATYIVGNPWLSVIAMIMVSSLIAFYYFNRFPAKIFPGDSLTWSVGALIAIIAILGNIEKIAVFFFIPYIIETILKSRGKLEKHSFGKPNKDGSLEIPYDKVYGLEHLAIYLLKKMKKNEKVYEKDVVYLINAFQIAIIIVGFLIFL